MVCVNKIKLCHLVKNQGSEVTPYLYHLVELDPNDLNTTITYTLASTSRCLVASACPPL